MKNRLCTLIAVSILLGWILMACSQPATPTPTPKPTPLPPSPTVVQPVATPKPSTPVPSNPTGALVPEDIQTKVKDMFAEGLVKPVKLVLFIQSSECPSCEVTRKLVEEVAALSDKVDAEIYNFVLDKAQVEQYAVDKVPAMAIVSDTDYGIRFYGIPSGYEFKTLIEVIVDVSRGESGLSDDTIQALSALNKPVHIQVFFAPTCPYCPQAVKLAHKLALQSEYIRSDAIDAPEFIQLAKYYNVEGVPRTVINETTQFSGAASEEKVLQQLLAAVKEE